MEIVSIITLILKFWDQVSWFVKKIDGTPAENREKMIASIHSAFEKSEAPETKDDTSAVEDIIAS